MMQSNSVGDMVVHMREIVVYVCWGGMLDEGVNGLITYVGGRNACMWISPSMGVGDVLKLLEREMGGRLVGLIRCTLGWSGESVNRVGFA